MAIGRIKITINPAQAAQANIVRGRLSRAERTARRRGAEVQAQSCAAEAVRSLRRDGRAFDVRQGGQAFERLAGAGMERIELPAGTFRRREGAEVEVERALRAAFFAALTAQNTLEGLRAISAVEIAGDASAAPAKAAPARVPSPARARAASLSSASPPVKAAKAQTGIPELKYKMSLEQKIAIAGAAVAGALALGLGASIVFGAVGSMALVGVVIIAAVSAASTLVAVSETKKNRANYRGEGILSINEAVYDADRRQAIKNRLIGMGVGRGIEVFYQRADSISRSSDGYWEVARETRAEIGELLAVDRTSYGPVLCETATTRVVFFAYQTRSPYGRVNLLELTAIKDTF